MAYPFADDRYGMRRLKSNNHEVKVEDVPWDSASTAANNTQTGPVSVAFVGTNSLVNNFSNG